MSVVTTASCNMSSLWLNGSRLVGATNSETALIVYKSSKTFELLWLLKFYFLVAIEKKMQLSRLRLNSEVVHLMQNMLKTNIILFMLAAFGSTFVGSKCSQSIILFGELSGIPIETVQKPPGPGHDRKLPTPIVKPPLELGTGLISLALLCNCLDRPVAFIWISARHWSGSQPISRYPSLTSVILNFEFHWNSVTFFVIVLSIVYLLLEAEVVKSHEPPVASACVPPWIQQRLQLHCLREIVTDTKAAHVAKVSGFRLPVFRPRHTDNSISHFPVNSTRWSWYTLSKDNISSTCWWLYTQIRVYTPNSYFDHPAAVMCRAVPFHGTHDAARVMNEIRISRRHLARSQLCYQSVFLQK